MLLYWPLDLYIADTWDIAAIIPAVIKQIKRLYIGITKPYSPIPTGPISFDK